MINKEEFCKFINIILEYNSNVEDLRKVDRGLSSAIVERYSLQDTVIELLARCMNLPKNEYYGNSISWWVYEDDFGRKQLDVFHNDKISKINTAEELYDLCVDEAKQNG